MDLLKFVQPGEGDENAQNDLSTLQRTRLGISKTWYKLIDTLGIKKLKEIILGVNTLPVSDQPLYLLGKQYFTAKDGQRDPEAVQLVAEDFASRVWMTYRNDFEAIGTSGLTNDAGWGCTLRSGQMLLANALLIHHFGRDWKRVASEEKAEESALHKVISVFFDSTIEEKYFSIQHIISQGQGFGIKAGHWIGPYVLCQTFNSIISKVEACPISCYFVAEPGGIPTLCREQAYECAKAKKGEWTPLLILIPVTLGATPSINPCYVPQILTILSMPQGVGIIGGRPGSSLYLLGRQNDRILYLDPHTLQDAKATPEAVDPDLNTYFCGSLQHLFAGKLDPSLAIGFYCNTEASFEDLYRSLTELQKSFPASTLLSLSDKMQQKMSYDISTSENDEDFTSVTFM